MARKMIHLLFKKVALWEAIHQTMSIKPVNHQNLQTFYIQLRILVKIKFNNLKNSKNLSFKKIQPIKITWKLIQTKIKIRILIKIINISTKKNKFLDVGKFQFY